MAEQKIDSDDVEAEAERTIKASRALIDACRERQAKRAETRKKLLIDRSWPERLFSKLGSSHVGAARESSQAFTHAFQGGFNSVIARAKHEHDRTSGEAPKRKAKRRKLSV